MMSPPTPTAATKRHPEAGKMHIRTVLIALTLALPAAAQDENGVFILRTTDKAPDEVVEAIRSYSEANEWVYVGDSKVKQGQVTLVKICIPEVGRALWPAGLHLSAMLPCGNIGVYSTKGSTEVSTLHPRYLQVLYPHEATEAASEIAEPLLLEMLATVSD
jgi:hypothetical protein